MKINYLYLFTLLIIFSCNNNQELNNKKKELRHVVLIKFKDSVSKNQISNVVDKFISLRSEIKEIKKFEWGINNSPEHLNKGFTHSFILTFNNEKDRATYLPHPAHQKFVNHLKPVLEDVLVIDYWVDN